MAVKILGQANPAGAAVLYTVPAGKASTISSIVMCNGDAALSYNYEIHVMIDSASADATNLIFIGTLAPLETFVATIGITLGATDRIGIYSSSAGPGKVVFHAFGDES